MRFDQLRLVCLTVLLCAACGEEPVEPADTGTTDVVLDQGPALDVPSGHVKLSIFKTGDGGVLRSEPAGVECGDTCFAEFPVGTEVHLFAEPDSGYRFTGFGGDCEGLDACTLTMDEPKEVGVTWKPYAPTLVWAVNAGGSGDDALTSLAATGDDDFFVTGVSQSTDLTWDETTFDGGGDKGSFFLAKVSADGQLSWRKEFVAADSPCASPLVVSDAAGNAIVAGVAGENTDLSGGMGVPSHGQGTFLAQFGPDGTLNWYTLFEGGCINTLKVSEAGQIAIAGKVKMDGANFGGETHSTSANATSAFVAVFDATGLTKWSRVFATQELDVAEAYDLLIAKDGTVTLIAFFQNTGNVSFGGDVLPDGHAMVVARYDADGGHLWSKPFGGVYSHLRRLVQGAKGTLYVAGWESPGAAQENFVARLSADGEEVARWEFPLEEKQEPVALIPVSGGFYFVGRIYDPYENQENFFLLRMTEGFLIEYSMDLGGKHTDILTSAALANEAELVLAGSTNSATIEFGENALTNEGGGKDTPSSLMLFRLSGL